MILIENMPTSRLELKNYLAKRGLLNSPALQRAFSEIDRRDFVSEEYADLAYEDFP